MKNFLLIINLFFFGCSTYSADGNSFNQISSRDTTIVLFEDSINEIKLPFNRKDMELELKTVFKGFNVKKETGDQDGPDFPLFSISKDGNEILFFSMDYEDTLKLNEVIISHNSVVDVYGVKIGDSYLEIKNKRNGKLQNYTDIHQHTYAYFEDSNILYEIGGYAIIPDSTDMTHLKFTEDQIKNWKIEHILWRKKYGQ